MKKIDTLANTGMDLKSGKRTFVVEISYQGDDEYVTKEVGGLSGRCIAYLEKGFLVGDGEKWYFHDAGGNLLATTPKTDLGECIQISVLGDFYVFAKSKRCGSSPASGIQCVNVRGERIQKAGSFMGMSPKELFAADDPILEHEDGEFEEEGSRWSELKEMNRRIATAYFEAEAKREGKTGEST